MCSPTDRGRPWMRFVLLAAAVYNWLWSAWMIAAPEKAFELAGLAAPNYPELWQANGMIIGVWGIGYAIAALSPFRYWPIVLMGLLAKAGAVAGFFSLAASGRVPWTLGWVWAANDLIWIPPFALILYGAYDVALCRKRITSPEVQRIALRTRTEKGAALDELSRKSPVMLVFLRYLGCSFCREALADLARMRHGIQAMGTRIVLVHMACEEKAAATLKKYGMEDIDRVSDPKQAVYRAFGLRRGRLLDLFGPKVLWRGIQAGIPGKEFIDVLGGDRFQMPGVFVIYHGQVLRSFTHQSAADRPDYLALASDEPYPHTGTVA